MGARPCSDVPRPQFMNPLLPESPPRTPSGELLHPLLRALLVSVVLAVGVEVAARLGYRAINPTTLFLLAIIYATFVAGVSGGLASAAVATAYLLYFLYEEAFTGAFTWRMSIYLVGAAGTIVLVGLLQKRARQYDLSLIRQQRDYANALVASLQDGLIARDASGRLIEVNESFCRMTGFNRDELLGQTPPYPYWPEEELAQIRPIYEKYMSGEMVEHELIFRRMDGERFPVLVTASRLQLMGQERGGFVATVKDLTQHRQAEQVEAGLQAELERQHRRMERLLENVPGVVWEAYGRPGEPSRRVSFVNKHIEKMLGYTVEEWLSRPDFWLTIVHEQDRERAGRELAELYEVGGGVMEFRWVGRDGSVRWVQGMSRVIYDRENRPIGMCGVTMDISQRKQAEEALRQRAEEIAVMADALEERNRELDQFAYIASHDLKAPLRGIANLSQWMEEDLGDTLPAESKEQMELLRGRVRRMEALIDGILQYSRVGRVHSEPESVDVSQLLAEVVELLDPPPGFRIEVQPGMPILTAERLRLQQVFMNLVGNAIKHHNRPDGQVTVAVRDLGQWYEFSVSDDGPGIAPQYHDRIFVIFQTLLARDTMEGTGVGLSLVKKIVEHEGGRVSVESEEGSGSTFRFTWPREFRRSNRGYGRSIDQHPAGGGRRAGRHERAARV
jgi:PAS domain S-box-containing protein